MRKVHSLLLLFAFAAVLLLSACGGGGDGTPAANPTPTPTPVTPAPQVLTGVFVDGPVEGVAFVSGAQTGTTDASGAFKFEAGGTVQFKVGNVTLGTAPGKSLITPVDLVKAVDPTATSADARVVQITQFLMTCNANPALSTTMSIPAVTSTAAAAEAAVNLSQAPADVAAILGRIVPRKNPGHDSRCRRTHPGHPCGPHRTEGGNICRCRFGGGPHPRNDGERPIKRRRQWL